MTTFILLLFLLFLSSPPAEAVSLIAGVPNAEVTERGVWMVAHESQAGITPGALPWNGLSFITYGLGENWELASSIYNQSIPSSGRLAMSFGFKYVTSFPIQIPGMSEGKFFFGSEIPVSFEGGDRVGVWAFTGISYRIEATQTRFTAGPGFGTSLIYGKNLFMAQLGIEQPLKQGLSLIGDWFSGDHDLGALIVAIQWDPNHRLTIISGPKISSFQSSKGDAWILEVTLKI